VIRNIAQAPVQALTLSNITKKKMDLNHEQWQKHIQNEFSFIVAIWYSLFRLQGIHGIKSTPPTPEQCLFVPRVIRIPEKEKELRTFSTHETLATAQMQSRPIPLFVIEKFPST
jgi:hypothetical protein